MEMFGSDPSPAVRVQIQAAKIRLQSFARVQHGLRNEGWRSSLGRRRSRPELWVPR
jgi:hypothetical protein